MPDEGIYVEDLTQVGYVGRLVFPVYAPRTYIHSGYQGTLGFGFATALGAKVGRPDLPVVSISGDGGFMYNVQELATAAPTASTSSRSSSPTAPTATSGACRRPNTATG